MLQQMHGHLHRWTFASSMPIHPFTPHIRRTKYFPGSLCTACPEARRSSNPYGYVPVIMVVIGKHAVAVCAQRMLAQPWRVFPVVSECLSRFAGHAANVLPLRQDYSAFAGFFRVSSECGRAPCRWTHLGASEVISVLTFQGRLLQVPGRK